MSGFYLDFAHVMCSYFHGHDLSEVYTKWLNFLLLQCISITFTVDNHTVELMQFFLSVLTYIHTFTPVALGPQ